MLKKFAILAICSLPSLAYAEDAKWVCMKHGKEVKTKGEDAKDKEKDCVAKDGTWEKNKAKEAKTDHSSIGGSGGGW